jgi:hypothetical protein
MNRVRNILLALPRFEGSAKRLVVKTEEELKKNVPLPKELFKILETLQTRKVHLYSIWVLPRMQGSFLFWNDIIWKREVAESQVSLFQLCDVATFGDHPQEELVKFGYRSERK